MPFHAMQDGIERACAESISMPAKLVDHRLAEDRSLRRVMQDVEADEA